MDSNGQKEETGPGALALLTYPWEHTVWRCVGTQKPFLEPFTSKKPKAEAGTGWVK